MAIGVGCTRTTSASKDILACQRAQHPKVTRSEFWFADGNIILLANGNAFKVHRGLLERHSEVFRDLFALPPPRSADTLYDCAFVEIHDSPADVLRTLQALYDGLYFKRPQPADFDTIAAVLRLSQKYFIQHLQEQSLERLEHDWPSTLSEWDKREKCATDDAGHYSPRQLYTHPVLVMNVARELAMYKILPAVFYDLSRYGPSKIAAGTPSSKPLAPAGDPVSAWNSFEQTSTPEITHLSDADLCATLRGRESAQRFIATFIDEHLAHRNIAESCLNKDQDSGRECRESFYFIMLNVMRSVGGIACGRDADPLFTLLQAGEMLERTDFSDGVRTCGLKICHACKNDFSKTVQSAREKVWVSIPGWFGLDDGSVHDDARDSFYSSASS